MKQIAARPVTPANVTRTGIVQRACACGNHAAGGECESCRKKRGVGMQRAAVNDAESDEAPEIVHEVLRAPAGRLDDETQALMGSQFGHDFSGVRVHTDSQAAASARAVNAYAYTVGRDVVFGAGQYAPGTHAGQKLLAHELAHVVQQEQGGAAMQEKLRVGAADDAYERKADWAAHQVSAGQDVVAVGQSGLALQRQTPPNLFPPPVSVPTPTPNPMTTPGPGPAPKPTGASPFDKFTKLRFSLGAVNFAVDLPSKFTASLPVMVRDRKVLEFQLTGGLSGDFSFSATYDGIPQVRISAKAGISGVGGPNAKASAGLSITTTKKVCSATSPITMKANLQAAGDKLKKAIEEVQSKPDRQEGESEIDVAKRYGELAAAIGGVHSAVEKAQKVCNDVPVVSFEFGARSPLAPLPGETNPDRGQFIGGSLTFHF